MQPINQADHGEITKTNATIALTEVAEKGVDVDVLHQIVQFVAQRRMELDVEGLWRRL